MKTILKECALFEVKNYDNSQLRNLLKEINKIGNSHAPANVKQTKIMKQLFKLEKRDCNSWINQYHNVKTAIEVEILHRVRNGII